MGKLFGTDGLRGVVGVFPLDNATVELLGRMLYFYLRERNLSAELILGRDTRDSGPTLLAALSRGFGTAGGKLEDAGILPTPALAYLARREGKCAISVTASHNPYPDNGIKIFGCDGRKISEEHEQAFEKVLLGEAKFERATGNAGSAAPVSMQQHYGEEYCKYLVDELFSGLDLTGYKIAVDCANGASYQVAPRVLRSLGADVTAFAITPDGKNINNHCGALHPEALFDRIRSADFFCGFTFDGDADRCLVADRNNIYDGDFILAAAALYLQSQKALKKNKVVATTMSNLGLELFLKKRDVELLRVPVGDKYVLEKLESADLSLGGEQSGHIIFMNDTFIGDGLITALQLLRISKAAGAPLAELCKGFEKCPQILLNIPVQKKPELSGIDEIREGIDQIQQELDGSGRILVRYSGTEMLARIMIEGKDQSYIERAAKSLGEIISRNLNQI